MEAQTNVQGEIAARNRRFVEAFKRRDAAAVAALYTRDAQLLPPNSDFVSGGDGIRAFWQGVMEMEFGRRNCKLSGSRLKAT